jgi:DNA-directed RNA polymerase specialized sigma24 family protein
MVLDVCPSVLVNEAEAEDAFQATFLILTRKAGSIRKAASVGSWLHVFQPPHQSTRS